MLLSGLVFLNCNSNSVFPMRLSPKSAMFILEPELIDLLCWLRIASSWFLFTNMYVSIMLLCINRLCIIGLCRYCGLRRVLPERTRLAQGRCGGEGNGLHRVGGGVEYFHPAWE